MKLETRDQNLKVGGGLNSILNEGEELFSGSAPKCERTETLPEETTTLLILLVASVNYKFVLL